MARIFTGVVSSAKPDKTIVVLVQTRKTDALYHKQYLSGKKFMAHDEKNEAKEGDQVSIIETRPISSKKRFKLNKIITRPKLTKDDIEIDTPEAAK
jgi:small subunit ribosomal protein S17